MKKSYNIFYTLFFVSASLFGFTYEGEYAESDFYEGKYDKIVRFAPISFAKNSEDENLSHKLQRVIGTIKQEIADPTAKVSITVVGYSEPRKSKQKAVDASRHYVQLVTQLLHENNISQSYIYQYAEGDREACSTMMRQKLPKHCPTE
ncbi:MAG: hypothetical protein FAF04_06265 [Epsilonproteobacteria bacterium]|nr:hypothetical protein [Campylobacterota bacterium]